MMQASHWTSCELEIVRILACKVRLLSALQLSRIAACGLSVDQAQLQAALSRLQAAELVDRYILNITSLAPVESPVLYWRPDSPRPDYRSISNRLRGRWRGCPTPTEIVVASRKAANLIGTYGGNLPSVIHRDHDWLLGEVYTIYREHRPTEARLWVGEDELGKAGFRQKDPDAFLFADATPLRVIESGGRYSATQVRALCDHCAKHAPPLELEIW